MTPCHIIYPSNVGRTLPKIMTGICKAHKDCISRVPSQWPEYEGWGTATDAITRPPTDRD